MFSAIARFCKKIANTLSSYVWRCVMRLVVWLLAVSVAAFPPLYAADSALPPWHPHQLIERVTAAGLFRDLFYVTIIISIIGLSNILFIIFVAEGYINNWIKAGMFVMIVVFLFFIMSGIGEFSVLAKIAEGHAPPVEKVEYDTLFLTYAAMFGVATELVLAVRNL